MARRREGTKGVREGGNGRERRGQKREGGREKGVRGYKKFVVKGV